MLLKSACASLRTGFQYEELETESVSFAPNRQVLVLRNPQISVTAPQMRLIEKGVGKHPTP
jgi:hypothetical protein